MGIEREDRYDLEGVHGAIKVLDLECVRPLDRPDFSRTMGCCDGR